MKMLKGVPSNRTLFFYWHFANEQTPNCVRISKNVIIISLQKIFMLQFRVASFDNFIVNLRLISLLFKGPEVNNLGEITSSRD